MFIDLTRVYTFLYKIYARISFLLTQEFLKILKKSGKYPNIVKSTSYAMKNDQNKSITLYFQNHIQIMMNTALRK